MQDIPTSTGIQHRAVCRALAPGLPGRNESSNPHRTYSNKEIDAMTQQKGPVLNSSKLRTSPPAALRALVCELGRELQKKLSVHHATRSHMLESFVSLVRNDLPCTGGLIWSLDRLVGETDILNTLSTNASACHDVN